jgi:hypothetical protein
MPRSRLGAGSMALVAPGDPAQLPVQQHHGFMLALVNIPNRPRGDTPQAACNRGY